MKENYLEIKVSIPEDGQIDYDFVQTYSYDGNKGSGGAGVMSKENLIKHFEKLLGTVQFKHNNLCSKENKCRRCLSNIDSEDVFCSKCGLKLKEK